MPRLCCPLTGFSIRHSFLKRGAASLLQVTGFESRLEVPLPQSNDRPADILLLSSFAEPRHHALDVSLVHPLQPSLPFAEVTPVKLADRRAAAKEAFYGARCSVAGMAFTPLVFETTGAWGTATTQFIRRWALILAMKTGNPAAQTFRSLAWAVSALVAEVVGDHLSRARCLQPASLTAATIPEMPMDSDSEPLQTAAAMPEMPVDADCDPFQLVTTPLMEVDSEPQWTRAKDPERPPPPVQPSSDSAVKVINLNEQREWSEQALPVRIVKWTAQASPRTRALRELQSSAHCGDWLCIHPDSCELISLLPANESQLLFSFKLGLPVFSCATCPACCSCCSG